MTQVAIVIAAQHNAVVAMARGSGWKPAFEDEEIQVYLEDVAGEDGVKLFKFILDNEPITGMEILEAHEETKPSDVRKVLYKLMMAHALEYHKDTDASGWETFHWRTDLPELKLIHERRWAAELQDLRKELRFEKDHEFYDCPDGHGRIIFEDAYDSGFKCGTCQAMMSPQPNGDVRKDLEARIDELETALAA